MNRAAALGPTKFPWWLDWRGATAAVVASGPSIKGTPLEYLRGFKSIVIKDTWALMPWADACYGCEAAFWMNALGLPEYRGLKLAWDKALSGPYPDIHLFDLEMENHHLRLDEPGVIGCGGNSGFQAVNIAAQFGATRIVLVGFDMHDKGGTHWYGRTNARHRTNPDEGNFKRWRQHFEDAAPEYAAAGIEIVNGSPASTVTAFPRRDLAEIVEDWGHGARGPDHGDRPGEGARLAG